MLMYSVGLGSSLHLRLNFMYASSEGSGVSANSPRQSLLVNAISAKILRASPYELYDYKQCVFVKHVDPRTSAFHSYVLYSLTHVYTGNP